eukprot:761298-Hanusia_phi.AAC.4
MNPSMTLIAVPGFSSIRSSSLAQVRQRESLPVMTGINCASSHLVLASRGLSFDVGLRILTDVELVEARDEVLLAPLEGVCALLSLCGFSLSKRGDPPISLHEAIILFSSTIFLLFSCSDESWGVLRVRGFQ